MNIKHLVLFAVLGNAFGFAASQPSDADAPVPKKIKRATDRPLLLPNSATGRIVETIETYDDARHHPHIDCSHLVNKLYVDSGLNFSYASSYELYAGKAPFTRVRTPQAGDLIVWPGHVGIVLNPTAHTFYSQLRRGAGEDDYTSRYWRRRGRPRFFRYTLRNEMEVAALRTPERPAELDRHAVAAALDPNARLTADTPGTSKQSFAAEPERFHVVEVASQHKKPKNNEISEAISNFLDESSQNFREREIDQPVIVVDKFEVKHAHIKGESGSVDVDIYSGVSATGQPLRRLQRSTDQWNMHRTSDHWALEIPAHSIYVWNQSRELASSELP